MNPEHAASSACDNSTFYGQQSLHAVFYDQLYGTAVADNGDLAFYDALIERTGNDILDAGCGTGRVFAALARPARRIWAFDDSAALLEQAHERAHRTRTIGKVHVTQQRLESFAYEQQFDVILLPYYAFSHLTAAAQRQACLQRIAQHLRPGGRAVLHLPAPGLLTREVPETELHTMRATYRMNTQTHGSLQLEQRIMRMDFDAARSVRTLVLHTVLKNPAGQVLKEEHSALHYVSLTAQDLQAEAASAGLVTEALHTGFKPGVDTELVAVFTHAAAKHKATA